MDGAGVSVVPSAGLDGAERREILALCRQAYGEDLTALFRSVGPAVHVVAREGRRVVSHAMWVTRYLQPAATRPLRTAYVEAVATSPAHERRGHATRVMQRLVETIPADYALAALCPATAELYARLGWQPWRGPLAIRHVDGHLEPTPKERVMVLALPGRPRLDLAVPLSAEWREGELW